MTTELNHNQQSGSGSASASASTSDGSAGVKTNASGVNGSNDVNDGANGGANGSGASVVSDQATAGVVEVESGVKRLNLDANHSSATSDVTTSDATTGATATSDATTDTSAASGPTTPNLANQPASKNSSPQSLSPENCTLYVRDLDPLVSEAHLFKVFSIYGTIKSIRVMKDNYTKRSLGYAFVNYTMAEYAQNALRDVDLGHKIIIKNRACKVLPFQRDPAKRHENAAKSLANTPSIQGASSATASGAAGATAATGTTDSASGTAETSGSSGETVSQSGSTSSNPPTRQASSTPTSDSNIFIKNLDPSITSAALYETFSVFGKIVSCKVATDEYGIPKGFAYVSFESREAAQDAIDRMNGVLMNDREVYVGFHVPKCERLNRLNQTFTNVFVKNIDSQVTEPEFRSLFAQYGEIDSISLPLNNDGSCRGFGFVNFKTHDQAVKAMEELNDTLFHNRLIYVNRAQKKYEREEELRREQAANMLAAASAQNDLLSPSSSQKHYQGVNLYVKYLNKSLDDEGLKNAFSKFGTITSAKIMTDDTGESRGFGFVCYSNPQEAQDAINAMHDQIFQGNRLYVALAMRKDTRNKMMYLPPLGPGGPGQFGYLPGHFAGHQLPGQLHPSQIQTQLHNQMAAAGQLPFMPMAAAVAAAAAAAAAGGSGPHPHQQHHHHHHQQQLAHLQQQQQGQPPNVSAGLNQRQFNPLPPFYYPLAAAAAAAVNANGAASPMGLPAGIPPTGLPGSVSQYGSLGGPAGPNANFGYPPGTPPSVNRSRSSTPLGYRSNGSNGAGGPSISNGNNHNTTTTNSSSNNTSRNPTGLKINGNNKYPNSQNTSPASSTASSNSSHSRNKYSRSNQQRELYGSSLSAAIASAATPEAENQVIGEAIYPHALNHPLIHGDTQLAGKITGMLLEQDKAELLKWVDDHPILNRRIQQAYEAYDDFIKTSASPLDSSA
ncbi:polyadenylate-binding protein [Sugiyamaella lignohabitans]|uniref:Polyadenylate-binding protein, cytoplasmic and nuclear n=1 Tax=Sugiyamaella lignohabitans TaxID=796027 RepID=A0A161HFG9_9ASCO|nr:polyadenylate-binding protein [Sugiyamaella lignohabitans]ANB11271.1 polyadenylate-binding protein [Sugiyamaella lignohabitans]